jgi:gluconate 2-dehydrogenase gamma chain
MAGQGIERRDVLRVLALAAAASHYPGFHRWVFAHDGHEPPAGRSGPAGQEYQPQFFTAAEYAALVILTDLIVPEDDSPGAREAGVSEFIDFMAAHDVELQPRFRRGLGWLDARSITLHGKPFRDLASAEQTALLEHLAYARLHRDGEEEGRAFFRLVRDYTVMGFYTSRVGLEVLGYPGLQLYAESPGCPDPGDPQHRHRLPLGSV